VTKPEEDFTCFRDVAPRRARRFELAALVLQACFFCIATALTVCGPTTLCRQPSPQELYVAPPAPTVDPSELVA
jgi:hypothetical protein